MSKSRICKKCLGKGWKWRMVRMRTTLLPEPRLCTCPRGLRLARRMSCIMPKA